MANGVWTRDEDLILAETVLRHVREGSTALAAFEEVGTKLNRKASTVGFRWNGVVINEFKTALEMSKRQGYKVKREKQVQAAKQRESEEQPKVQLMMPVYEIKSDYTEVAGKVENLDYEKVIQFLTTRSKAESDLATENAKLKKENKELQEKLKQYEEMERNYNQIMNMVKTVNSQF